MIIESIKKVLNPKILCAVDSSNPNDSVISIYEEQSTKLKAIKLHIPTQNCVVFRLDFSKDKQFSRKSNYLHESEKGIHQGCDYVVACIHNDKLQFTLIELKSDDTSGANSQLWHSTPFINYLKSLLKIHFPELSNELEECHIKYLLFSTSPIHQLKTSTQAKIFKQSDARGFTVHIGGNPKDFYLGNILRA